MASTVWHAFVLRSLIEGSHGTVLPPPLPCAAEDLSKEHMTILQEVCRDEFEMSPPTALVYSALATRIRERVEKLFEAGKGWNVVVGRSFGASISAEF